MAAVSTYLNFSRNTEEAFNFYKSVFENSKIEIISRYGKEGCDIHGQKEGAVIIVSFQINGHSFIVLNGRIPIIINVIQSVSKENYYRYHSSNS